MADPTWFKDLLPAKFRGVPFKVFSHNRSGGTRGPDHEYPEGANNRRNGTPENTGDELNRWTFEAFILGDLHHEGAQNLIDALRGGRAELVHPRWGHQIAICRKWNHSESVDDGGISKFTLDFVDASEELGIAVLVVSDAIVADVNIKLKTATKAGFVETFNTVGLSGSVANQAIDDLILRTIDLVAAVQTPLAGDLDDAEAFFAAAEAISPSNLVSLIQTPADLADDLIAMFEAIGDRFALKSATSSRAASLTQGITLPSDPGEAQILLNADAYTRLFQRVLVGELAEATAIANFDSFDDAIAERDIVADLIEVEEGTPNTQTEFTELVDLRTELIATINERADNLVRLRDVVISHMTSTLEMAWDLYADANRADEIADRNREKIPHPGFVKPDTYRVLAE